MHTYLIEMLECPACHGKLDWNVIKEGKKRIEEGEASCSACDGVYTIREGIGLFLTPDLPRNDLWEQMDSGLIQYVKEHPELERQLMDVPLESLNPADQFFRSDVLESYGKYREAKDVEDLANSRLYEKEYMDCWKSEQDHLIGQISETKGPVVDIASGKCYLVEKIVRKLKRPVVATDFSPNILRRNRKWLDSFDLYDHVSLLAFDARRTPFKNSSVEALTTNVGLPNIEEPGNLLKELHRIVSGKFLAISNFLPEDDEENGKVIREAGLEAMVYRKKVLEEFNKAGWNVDVQNVCKSEAKPTATSEVIEGARIDGLPVADTIYEWCVLEATP